MMQGNNEGDGHSAKSNIGGRAMGSKGEVQMLMSRSKLMYESMRKSQVLTDSIVNILRSFDRRLSSLETDMRPMQIQTHAFRRANQNIDLALEATKTMLNQFDVSHQMEDKLLEGPKDDLGGFLSVVNQLHTNVEFLKQNQSFKATSFALDHANSLLSKSMAQLIEEFKNLFNEHSKPVESTSLIESLLNENQQVGSPQSHHNSEDVTLLTSSSHNNNTSDHQVLPDLILPDVIPRLCEMVQWLVAAGHQEQCLKTYRDVRAPILDQSLQNLGVEKLSKEEVQKMQWETLEGKIISWNHHMQFVVKLLFVAEYKICDQIWLELTSQKEKCFSAITHSSMHTLISFGEAITTCKKSPEKLFVLLDMYETMSDLEPQIKSLFQGESGAEIRDASELLLEHLAQATKDTFNDFADAVEKDAMKTTVADGTVHPLTSYVVNYIKFMVDYQDTLNKLFGEKDIGDKTTSHLASAVIRIMSILQTNLDGKSKLYKDPALTQFFLMNNIHYMVKSVRRSEVKEMLGDDWLQRHRRIVQQHATLYQRIAWNKALSYITGSALMSSSSISLTSGGSGTGLIGGTGDNGGVSKTQLKERLKNFNSILEDLHRTQMQWTVWDTDLRDAMRLQVAEVLLPAYRSFIKRYSSVLTSNTGHSNKYMKYSPEDLESLLGEFFEGKIITDHKKVF
ncbi:hypothetical protein BDL97_11G043000 [Sphagnum fallax]|nr:hypothetical protein BDL97_11G043000 [Sphagnum fallax]